jgi:hypothetical protein
MLLRWKSAVWVPKVWYQFYGQRLRLNRMVSAAHAWKLTQTWATDVQIFGCNMGISFTGKSTKELEDALSVTGRKRDDYYAWKSVIDVILSMWIYLFPWLEDDVNSYRRQLERFWDDVLEAMQPSVAPALERVQALHRDVMRRLDQDPYLLIGNKEVFKKAKARVMNPHWRVQNETVFEPGRWLDLEPFHRARYDVSGGVSQTQVDKKPSGIRPREERPRQRAAGDSGGPAMVNYCVDYNSKEGGAIVHIASSDMRAQ